MLHKVMVVLKCLQAFQIVHGEKATIGQIAKLAKMPKTTVRRLFQIAENSDLVDCELLPYKSTGKRVFWMNEKGNSWLCDYRGLGL